MTGGAVVSTAGTVVVVVVVGDAVGAAVGGAVAGGWVCGDAVGAGGWVCCTVSGVVSGGTVVVDVVVVL